ncbi:MAG TPA: fused MFS/spermidine synthase [Candidatus Acidoferrales bacterium]|nr:fused MFS/spermidine synthase [Candidatus Acidoferrales bacterium]
MNSRISYGVTIFVGAFLLFEIEPLIAKRILPWFGGAAAVWIICLLFFQLVLLLGYAYAHWLTSKFAATTQSRIHAALLILSILFLPVYPKSSWQPTPSQSPTAHILLLLAATIGFPYFLLSSTSPLFQSWYAAQHRVEPYRFYSLSNIGSMLALLSYPVTVEPWLTTHHQAIAWSVTYAAFVALCVATAFSHRGCPEVIENAISTRYPSWSMQLLWVALAACGSALLLAITNHITQNIAAVPLLWIIPLSLYLLTFILCFASHSFYPRSVFLRLLAVVLGGMTYALSPSFLQMPVKVAVPLFCVGLFVACMFCHGELARLKPDPQHLTSFYLMVAAGGALGAVFVAAVAPNIFAGFYELHVAIGMCAVLIVIVYAIEPGSPFSIAKLRPAGFALAALAIAIAASLAVNARNYAISAQLTVRNFYGVLRVMDGSAPNVAIIRGDSISQVGEKPAYRSLVNGTINHGAQFLARDRRRWATTYYSHNSGIGVALQAAEKAGPVRIGIIGLGAGTTAVYGRAGDYFTYYEINPLVIHLARQEFTFLKDSPATINIIQGDARLSLERQPPQNYDVLVVDAFSGDSIPVHLLTHEAFQLYFQQLKPDGVLAVHISNSYLDLEPVVASAAANLHKEAVLIHNSNDPPKGIFASIWVLVGSPGGFEGRREIEAKGLIIPPSKDHLWTDDYSNLFEVLR